MNHGKWEISSCSVDSLIFRPTGTERMPTTTPFCIVQLCDPRIICTERAGGLSENVVYTPKPNGFADHYPVFKWLAIIGNINPTFSDKPRIYH